MKPWKVQKFASDVVHDLRSRNMLSIAVMLVLGIILVPIAISMSSSTGSGPSGSQLTAGTASDLAPEAQAAVLAYNPGVRNYKRRLEELRVKDPFRQQFRGGGGGEEASAALDQAVETIGGGGGAPPPNGGGGGAPPPTGGSGETGTSGGGGTSTVVKTKTKTRTRYFTHQLDVEVGEAGGTMTRIRDVEQFQFLPSEQVPVLVFLGVVADGDQGLFLVSKNVVNITGEGICFPDPTDCQLLALNEDGDGADLTYAPDGKTYHVGVPSIKRKTTSRPPGD